MEISAHAARALAEPSVIELEPGFYALRFETMKIASARAAVARLLADGVVVPGDTVVDSSSGIYALALAMACHEADLKCVIVGSTTIDAGIRAQVELLGATIDQMPPTTSLRLDQDRRVARVRQLVAKNPRMHWMRQYHDPVHDDGYLTLGEQLAHALERRGHDHVRLVGAIGSGVSSFALGAGIERVLTLERVGVQPFGSVTFGAEHVEDPDIIIAGIGSSIPFGNVRHQAYDVVHWVGHDVACAATTELMRQHALFAGLSSGAAWAVARDERRRCVEDGDDTSSDAATVAVLPDTGHRYVEAVHARHGEHAALSRFTARQVSSVDELSRPWSRMEWARRPAPEQARYVACEEADGYGVPQSRVS